MSTQHTRETRSKIWRELKYCRPNTTFIQVKNLKEAIKNRPKIGPKYNPFPKGGPTERSQRAILELLFTYGVVGASREQALCQLKILYNNTSEKQHVKIFIDGENSASGEEALKYYTRELFYQGLIEVKYDNIFEPDDKLDLKDTIFKEMIIN